ncbi:dihydrofolate reductase [Methylomagnum sp.]
MKLALIVAMGENRVIGVDNRMPWHLSADLKRFRQITLGKPVIMGRRTHESIGRPLPGRKNIVLTTDRNYAAAGCTVVHGLDEALREAVGDEAMVIGGSALYGEFLPRAERLYLTLIHRAFDGDTFFPEFDWNDWREMAREDVAADPDSGLSYSFLVLERMSAAMPSK